jgi:hypothetical protein
MVFRGQDLWRAAPIFKFGVFDVLPGLREGVALFVVYLGYEFATTRGGAGHGHAAAGAADAHAHAHDAVPHAAAHGHGGGHGGAAPAAKLH